MKHNTVIYHSADLDGHCSGAIAAAALKAESPLPVVMIGWDYGRPVPYINPTETETLVVTDLCPDAGQMLRWNDTLPRFIWIDHHKTGLEAFSLPELAAMNGLREIGRAACELAWEYFHPAKPLPQLVHALGRYDVFAQRDQVAWNNFILPVQYAMRARETDPVDEKIVAAWSSWIRASVDYPTFIQDLKAEGTMLMRYENSLNAAAARASAFECLFQGLPAIAKSFGGGGHKNAAGFRHDHFLLGTPLPSA